MKKSAKKKIKKQQKTNQKAQKPKRKTNIRVVITGLFALLFMGLSLWNLYFIIPTIILWWMNRRYIQKL